MQDGTVYAWGYNQYGQLGKGDRTTRKRPSVVAGLTDVMTVAVGHYHSLALKSDGTVMAWGRNNYGQLGLGTTVTKLAPVEIPGLSDVVAIAAGGQYSLAVLRSGEVRAWGNNEYGQLGDGTKTTRLSPVAVTTAVAVNLTGVKRVSAGSGHTVALMQDGTAKAWGKNSYGQLGIGSTKTKTRPVTVPNLSNVKMVDCGSYHTLALLNSTYVKAWGLNSRGQLGIGTTVNKLSPVSVRLSSGDKLVNVKSIGAGAYHSIALKTSGKVNAWGRNSYGALGDGTTVTRKNPRTVYGITTGVAVNAGGEHSTVIKQP